MENMFTDPITNVQYNRPVYSANSTLTRRSFLTRNRFKLTDQPYLAYEMVPVTHVCEGGCGTLLNASVSAYVYDRGVCVAPNTCVCLSRKNNKGPAFFGSNCETTKCDNICHNGVCVYNSTVNDTSCVCQSVRTLRRIDYIYYNEKVYLTWLAFKLH